MAALMPFRFHLLISKQIRSMCTISSTLCGSTGSHQYDSPRFQARCYATQRHRKLILEAQKRNRQRKMQKPVEKPKTFLRAKNIDKLLLKPKRETEDHLPPLSKNVDDVYLRMFFPKPSYPAAEVIEMHKETHHPTILNDPEALLYAFVELDLSLKKKNRYREDFSGTVLYPHSFEITKKQKRIMALTKSADVAREALEAGADVAGGPTLIKQILAGEADYKSFDYVIASVDIIDSLPQLRGLLKQKYPVATNGTVTADLPALVARFLHGVDFSSNSDPNELDYGFLQVPTGRLNMETDQLVENIKVLLQAVEAYKPKGTNPGTFITKVELKSPPSTEYFKIKYDDFLPTYKDVKKEEQESDDEAEAEQTG